MGEGEGEGEGEEEGLAIARRPSFLRQWRINKCCSLLDVYFGGGGVGGGGGCRLVDLCGFCLAGEGNKVWTQVGAWQLLDPYLDPKTEKVQSQSLSNKELPHCHIDKQTNWTYICQF